ncbi:choice-of-anchor B family protein [Paraglaciecola sp. 25GB23A]|uniref:choice-of-anchor B family protein n=1 Tax=Paraglaciecola sp. 25GB23A TaxID=3156068 RepID=UPI0032AEC43D
MLTRLFKGGIMLLTLAFSQGILAHAEHDKARFVANNGIDEGLCNNRFRPCKTVTYAAQQAAKGDKILVAQGQYQISTEQDLLYISGQVVTVLGGFDQIDQYQNQNPDTFITSLSGVPADFAEQLSQQGFHVIRDSKSLPQVNLLAKGSGFSALNLMQKSQTASNCDNGSAAGFACENISLLSHLALSEFPSSPNAGNDIWGHIDLNTGKEYAIIGLSNAISVVDVSEPESPVIVGSISGQATSWRDIKVWQYFDSNANRWQAYAYATADNVSEGLTIINLSGLPQSISLVTRQTLDASAHNVYISNVDYGLNIALTGTEPLLHVAGSNRSNGAFRSYSLLNPESLSLQYQMAGASRNDYTHDASSLLITDSRAQTDCVNATDIGCNVLLDFNENTLRIWDHSSANQAVELSSSNYPLAEYTHSGWWTEDKQFVIVHDELDEQRHNINTTLNIFEISSLTQPSLVGTWTGPTRAIDHNGFVRGNHYFMSNYERGMTVLDITQAASPSQIGFFDTYPVSNNAAFNGAWGVYPFLPSGIILVSDINSGLFVLRDDTLTTNNNSVAFSLSQLSLDEGESNQITVNKSGSDSGSVAYEIISGSATTADRQISQGELSWSANDNAPQFIPVTINTDDVEESEEVFFVRLVNPRNGLALSYPNIIQVKINGVARTGNINFVQRELEVKENDGAVQIQLERLGGSSGQIVINYFVQSDSAVLDQDVILTAGSLVWDDGDSSLRNLQFSLIDDNLAETDESFLLVLQSADSGFLGEQNTLRVTIYDDESNQAPVANAGENLQLNPRQVSQLRGTGSDPEGRAVSYLWQQTSGTAVTLNNATTANSNFTAPASAGTLVFSFTVTDDFGLSTTDSVQINVIDSTGNDTNSSSGGGSLFALLGLAMLILALRWKRSQPS